MNDPIFQLSNVQKSYNGRSVLKVDKLSIEKGEILAVVGPSGSGKSTLLRLLNFLESPSLGHIEFDGQIVTPQISLEQRRRVTTVFQRPILLKRSVLANLQYGKKLRGGKMVESEMEEWSKRFGIQIHSESEASKISGGEAQRVALARALIFAPEVLLLDEPTANLDPYNVELIEKIVREENARRDISIVLVTHNIFQARRLAHRTALLLNGEIIEIAETERFFSAPQEAQTAAFLRGELIY